MCGIFGVIKSSPEAQLDIQSLRGLTMINRLRGKEALGFFDSNERILKRASDPKDVLATDEATDYLDTAATDSWFVVGHTRYSTRGKNIDQNSHPFNYGAVTGSHNGIIDSPASYTVDSEYIFDQLDKHNGDYQKALQDEWGYWTTSWYDNRTSKLYLTMHDNSCGLVKFNGCWFFSSDPDHLAAALGSRTTIILTNGDTYSFDADGNMVVLPKFNSVMSGSYKKDRRTSGGSSSKTSTSSSYYGSSYSGYSNSRTGKSHKNQNKAKGKRKDRFGMLGNSQAAVEFDNEFCNLWNDYADACK
jgi:hypothetical protein